MSGEIPSLVDLQNTKARIDHFAELIDGTPSGTSTNPVTGVTHPTYEKAIKDLGFKPASFTFVTGGSLGVTDADKCIHNPAPAGDDNWYSWGGTLPHSVAPGTDPTAVGSGYVPRTDVLLRSEITPSLSESLRRSYAEAGYNLVSGSFGTGATLQSQDEVLLNERDSKAYSWTGSYPSGGYVVAPGTDPSGSSEFVSVHKLYLRSDLLSPSGASIVNDGSASQADINAGNLIKYGPVPSPGDSTNAFASAYAAHDIVYVPEGSWYTTVLYPDRTYGPGTVLSNDQSFSDSGERPISASPERQSSGVRRHYTFGNLERAAGSSLIVNHPTARPEISGYSSDAEMANYVNRDHVGHYIGMYGPQGQVVTGASTTYTATTITSSEIVSGASEKIKLGMFIKTKHSPTYSGRIIDVNFNSNTITVSGWYREGNTSAGQVPENGTGATINAADKLWGQNTIIYLRRGTEAATATGYELGIVADSQPGTVWGFNPVNLSTYSLDRAFYASGKWDNGIYFGADVINGMRHISPVGASVLTIVEAASWSGSCVRLITGVSGSGWLARISNSDLSDVWGIKDNGQRTTQRESVTVLNSNASVTPTSPSILLCTNTSAITISPTGNFLPGQIFEVKSAAGQQVTFAGTVIPAGKYGRFVFDGSSWVTLLIA